MDTKRKNKMLKLAIERLQVEQEKNNQKTYEDEAKGETFLTDLNELSKASHVNHTSIKQKRHDTSLN